MFILYVMILYRLKEGHKTGATMWTYGVSHFLSKILPSWCKKHSGFTAKLDYFLVKFGWLHMVGGYTKEVCLWGTSWLAWSATCLLPSCERLFVTVCVSAAGLLCDPGADVTFLVFPEDSISGDPLCSCSSVFVGGGGHGRSWHSGWKRPGIQ